MEAKKTSLFNLHQKYVARFVEFAGYQMPIQYKDGIIQEHKFTRSNSGIFDVSHMGQLFITGEDDLTEDLENIFPIDLIKLNLNQSKYSFLMNKEGGIYDDLIITKMQKGYLIILNAACKYQDFKIIEEKLNKKYVMNLDESLSLIAIQGPDAKNVLEKIVPNSNKLKFMNGNKFYFKETEIYITRSGYTGEDGFEISIENKKAERFAELLIENGSKLTENSKLTKNSKLTGGSNETYYNVGRGYVSLPAAQTYTIRFFGEVSSGDSYLATSVVFGSGIDSLLFRMY